MHDHVDHLGRSLAVLGATRSALARLQHEDGSWKGEFQTGAYVDALDLIIRCYLGIEDADHYERVAAGIVARQQPDGGWASDDRTPDYLATLSHPLRLGVGLARRLTRSSPRRLRRLAMIRAGAMVRDQQDPNGLFGGGIIFSSHFSMVALGCLGYTDEHPAMVRARDGLDTLIFDDGDVRRIEFCDSRICDTAFLLWGLSELELFADRLSPTARGPDLSAAVAYLLRHQNDCGGWGFEECNRLHPDTDTTWVVAMALRAAQRAGIRGAAVDRAVERARRWVMTRQHRSGGFCAFDVRRREHVPFRSFLLDKQVIEDPAPDVTGHLLEWLGRDGFGGEPEVQRGEDWLRRQQRADGSWASPWGFNDTFGIFAGANGLKGLGHANDPAVGRAAQRLIDRQNPDGGWGEDFRSYLDTAHVGSAHSTAQHTSVALRTLIGTVQVDQPSILAGVDYLLAANEDLGDLWAEPDYVYPLISAYDLWYRAPMWAAGWPVLALTAFLRSHPNTDGARP